MFYKEKIKKELVPLKFTSETTTWDTLKKATATRNYVNK